MAEGDSGRNLLYGVLALQMDFISREALVAATTSWVRDKSRPLGQILMEQGALDGETHALLEALVVRHLALHGDDIEKSLAAVAVPGSVRQDLETIGDAEVHASVIHLTAMAPTNPDPNATLSLPHGRSPSTPTRFHILRPHARGGLGEVHVAHDDELNREVALKQIQDHHADDPESRSRFLLEAEVTGRLEHPGVVPVYSLGRYEDGRPYYAMRFIKGESLKDAIGRFHEADKGQHDPGDKDLAFRQLLRRFVDACNAVGYAHSRGVVHRDIKPANIMLVVRQS
jgi:eukaryotic-like serine/threonine-protein kinase